MFGILNVLTLSQIFSHVLHNFVFVSFSTLSLSFSSQDVIEKTHLSGDSFNLYLHQNYLLFFSDIEDVVSTSLLLTLFQ